MAQRTRLEYADLRVTLHSAHTEGNTTTVQVFEGLDADNSVEVSFDRAFFWEPRTGETESFMARLDRGTIHESELYEIGELLADIALPTGAPRGNGMSVRDRFTAEEARAKAVKGGLRIQLVVRSPELAQLPWEYMAVKQSTGGWRERDFLALRRRISIVRVGDPVHQELHAPGDRLEVVAALASPGGDYSDLDLTKDRAALQQTEGAFAGDDRTAVRIRWVDPPTVGRLKDEFEESFDIFYFGGHGVHRENQTDVVMLTSEGGPDPYSATKLGQLLADRNVRLVVLGACDTGRTAGGSLWGGAADELMQAGIPYVVAYQAAIKDVAAGLAAATLWDYAIAGYSVDQAIAEARSEMLHRLRDSPAEWGKVVLHEAAGVGGRLFAVDTSLPGSELIDVLTEQLEEWLRENGAADRTRLYRSAVSEPTHDVISLEDALDQLWDPDLNDRRASPYRPFKHFSFEHREGFVRTTLSEDAARQLADADAMLVSGPAGSGKTSLVLAGVAPRFVESGHALIRIAEYQDLTGQLTSDLSDVGLVDVPPKASVSDIVSALAQQPSAKPPIVVLDQLEQMVDPAIATEAELADQIVELAKAASRGVLKLLLVTRERAESLARGLLLGIDDLDWKPLDVPYLSVPEAVDAIVLPPARLEKAVNYADGIPERIANELNLAGSGVQPALLAIVCDQLWKSAVKAGEGALWRIGGPDEGGVGRLLARALDDFLRDNLGRLSDTARQILGSPDLYNAPLWAELQMEDDEAQAAKRLVQLGVLARRDRPATEYRYSSPAVRELVIKSQPWQVRSRLDAQATLDSVISDWQRDLMPSRGHVAYLAASADQLAPTIPQRALLVRASLRHRLDPAPWVPTVSENGEDGGLLDQVAAADEKGRTITWSSEAGRALGVPKGERIEPPEGIGPYTWWALQAGSKESALAAGLIASMHDFGHKLDDAALADRSAEKRRRRRRQRRLWGFLDDQGRLSGARRNQFGVADRVGVFVAKTRARMARDRRNLGIYARRVGLLAGLALGLLQALNWLLVGWPSPSRFTDAVGQFFEFFVVGGLLGSAIGLGLRLPNTLNRDSPLARWLSGTGVFLAMSVFLELRDGREFWRRPVTVLAMGVSGALIVGAVVYALQRIEGPADSPPPAATVGTWPIAASASLVALVHLAIRLPDKAAWNGRLLFANSRDTYFVIFNQLHSSDTLLDAPSYILMSLANTFLAGLAVAAAALVGALRAKHDVAELRRTEERAPTEPPAESSPHLSR
jgi:hypothetical protein